MKKDNCRDYVVDAMRYYAQRGKPCADEIRRMRSDPSFCYSPEVKDMEAVCRMLERLVHEESGKTAVQCVEYVYFAHPTAVATRTMITERAQLAARTLCVSESSVYRALRRARVIVAEERGLRQ